MSVMIGIDPHKGSHAVVAVDDREQAVAEIEVTATRQQARRLLTWAEPFGDRCWAIVALRQSGLRVVETEDHVAVLRMLARRDKQLSSLKTQAAGRLHAVLATLIPGGLSKELVVKQASDLLRRIRPATMVEVERKRIAR